MMMEDDKQVVLKKYPEAMWYSGAIGHMILPAVWSSPAILALILGHGEDEPAAWRDAARYVAQQASNM